MTHPMSGVNFAKLVRALQFYADPQTYFAIGFFPDPPCGAFIKDFSDDHGDETCDGYRPGNYARKVLAELEIDPFFDWNEPYIYSEGQNDESK